MDIKITEKATCIKATLNKLDIKTKKSKTMEKGLFYTNNKTHIKIKNIYFDRSLSQFLDIINIFTKLCLNIQKKRQQSLPKIE